jgi:uncharacterized protein
MKRVVIVHGWEGGIHEPQLAWLREERGYFVVFENMPNPEEPTINEWVSKLNSLVGKPDNQTDLVGHSIGCQTVLRYLASLPEGSRLGKVVLIAPWLVKTEEQKLLLQVEGEEVWSIAKPWIETPIDFEKVKKIPISIACVFSGNDEFVSLDNVKLVEEQLGAKAEVYKNKGHFNPGAGITELPEVLKYFPKI